MTNRKRAEARLGAANLLHELERRCAGGSPSEALSFLATDDLWRRLLASATYITADSVTLEIGVTDDAVRRAAGAVVAILHQDRLIPQADGSWRLRPYGTLAEQYHP